MNGRGMTNRIVLRLPAPLDPYGPALAEFFDGMLYKLARNAHKATPTTADIPQIVQLLLDEVTEFEEQLETDRFDPNTLNELFDTANFAFLAYLALRLAGVRPEHGSAHWIRTVKVVEQAKAAGGLNV